MQHDQEFSNNDRPTLQEGDISGQGEACLQFTLEELREVVGRASEGRSEEDGRREAEEWGA
jgi:hypothetical protein